MKRTTIILFALLLTLPIEQLWAQEEMPYKPKAMFNADTLQYLEYNFSVIRSEKYYKGKTVEYLLNELEYPIQNIVEYAWSGERLISLSLSIKQLESKPNPLKDFYIIIYFTNPPQLSNFLKIYDCQNDKKSNFTSQIYSFIKNLKIDYIAPNPYIIMKREKLKMRKAQEENK